MSFQNLGLSGFGRPRCAKDGLRGSFADPVARDSADSLGTRSYCVRPDRHGKDGGFWAALAVAVGFSRAGIPRCLILEPTRELAMQVETAFRDFARFMHVEVALIHGGVGYGRQKEALSRDAM